MSVERTWILVMLIAGGLAGLAGAAVVLGTDFSLTFQSYGTYGFDAITVALLGRARPLGVVLAALLFGALHAGGITMQAATPGTPADDHPGHPGPDRAVRRRAAAGPRDLPAARATSGAGLAAAVEGVERMTALAAPVRALPVSRPPVHRAGHVHRARPDRHPRASGCTPSPATPSSRSPQASAQVTVPNLRLPAAADRYVLGAVSIALGVARAAVRARQGVAPALSIGVVLFCFVIALLCWADAGSRSR